MRRLLYLAIAVVFLSLIGLTVARVTHSGAYVARVKAMQIKEGMTREEVRQIMANLPAAWETDRGDVWEFGGGYTLFVTYADNSRKEVCHTFLGRYSSRNWWDDALECVGYPAAFHDGTSSYFEAGDVCPGRSMSPSPSCSSP